MVRACRNLGTRGLVMQAISAVDIALWDLAARLAGLPLAALFGTVRDAVPVYGSGGSPATTTLSSTRSSTAGSPRDVAASEDQGRRVVGRRCQRGTCGGCGTCATGSVTASSVMVDANGGYDRGQARRMGAAFDDLGVAWFEEPVTSDDLDGLAAVRAAVRCDVAAGEYVSNGYDAAALCPVVDCLQLDVTRCGGYTGWRAAAAVAAAAGLDVSAHCAPSLHLPITAAVPNVRHLEWFADHARLEPELVDGVPPVVDGALRLDPGALGHGMRLCGRRTG